MNDNELDALVAQYIFGWAWGTDADSGDRYLIGPEFKDNNGVQWQPTYWPTRGRSLRHCESNLSLPCYSSNIAAAFQVFKWLMQHGRVWMSNGDGNSCDMDFVPVGNSADYMHYANISADTYERAIVICALVAIGVLDGSTYENKA